MSSFPVAGWYDDGATAGVLRWFDGAAWTELTMPRPAPDPAPAFGGLPTVRLGQSLNLADHVTEGAEFQRHRLDDALRLRRRGFWMLGAALVVLVLAGAVAIAMHGADTIWYVGAVGAVLLCVRAWRDYQNATFRGAPVLTTAGWVLAGIALVVALVVFATGPLLALNDLAHLGDTVR
jgi:hypothetical protein